MSGLLGSFQTQQGAVILYEDGTVIWADGEVGQVDLRFMELFAALERERSRLAAKLFASKADVVDVYLDQWLGQLRDQRPPRPNIFVRAWRAIFGDDRRGRNG